MRRDTGAAFLGLPEQHRQPSDKSTQPLSPHAKLLLLLVPIFLIGVSSLTTRPSRTFLVSGTAFAPPLVGLILIHRYLKDERVSISLLINRAFVGAVPMFLLTLAAGMIMTVVWLGLLLALEIAVSDARAVVLDSTSLNGPARKPGGYFTGPRAVIHNVGFPFVVDAFVNELAKYFLADSVRRFAPVGEHGVIALTCAGGLGLALPGIFSALSPLFMDSTVFGLSGPRIISALFFFLTDVGTAFYIGVATAKKHIQQQRGSVAQALASAILFQGAYMSIPRFVSHTFAREREQSMLLVFRSAFLVCLALACARAYKQLWRSGNHSKGVAGRTLTTGTACSQE